jgi:hypothetical protein
MAEKQKPTTTTPDPEYAVPLEHMEEGVPAVLGGDNIRGEVAGCPTGLAGMREEPRPRKPGEDKQRAAGKKGERR